LKGFFHFPVLSVPPSKRERSGHGPHYKVVHGTNRQTKWCGVKINATNNFLYVVVDYSGVSGELRSLITFDFGKVLQQKSPGGFNPPGLLHFPIPTCLWTGLLSGVGILILVLGSGSAVSVAEVPLGGPMAIAAMMPSPAFVAVVVAKKAEEDG
jgi:hypothetical protein